MNPKYLFEIVLLYLASITYQQGEFKLNFTIEHFPKTTPKLHSFLDIPLTPMISNTENRLSVEFCFGTPPQCFKLVIQSNTFYMWVIDSLSSQKAERKFDASASSTIVKNMTVIQMYYYDDIVTAYTAKDELMIQQEKIGRLFFGLSKKSDTFTGYEGILGLGYTPQSWEEKYSFIEQLYHLKIIYHKVFTQSFTSSEKGELSFGKIPKNIVDDYHNYGRCQALDKIKGEKRYKNSNWQCEITGVFFGEKFDKSQVKQFEYSKVSFFSYRKRALIPLVFFDYLESHYFPKYINTGNCKRIKVKRYDVFSCDQDIIVAEEINLIFGEWAMRIPGNEIFKHNKYTDKYEFIFYHKQNYEKWTLGRPIVKNYHMVYDAHNEEIGFYSPLNVIRISSSIITPPKVYSNILDKIPNPVKEHKPKPNHHIPEFKPMSNITDIHKRPQTTNKFTSAFIIQILLLIFVIIVVISFVGFGIWMYIRYKRNNPLLDNDYFNIQSQKILKENSELRLKK